MHRILITALIALAASAAQAQTPARTNSVCGWGVLTTFTKATAASEHCTRFAGPNGFGTSHPKRSAWISDCSGIVNAAIATCADTDLQCQKDKIRPLQGQVCALNTKYQN